MPAATLRRAAPEQRAADHRAARARPGEETAIGVAFTGLRAHARARGGAALRPGAHACASSSAAVRFFDVGTPELGRRRHPRATSPTGRAPRRRCARTCRAGRSPGCRRRFVRDGTGALPNGWIPDPSPAPDQALPYKILPFDEMPQLVNPRAGLHRERQQRPGRRHASTTIRSTSCRPGGGIHYLASLYANGSRVGRITRLLQAEHRAATAACPRRHGAHPERRDARRRAGPRAVHRAGIPQRRDARRAAAAGRARARPGARRGGAAAAAPGTRARRPGSPRATTPADVGGVRGTPSARGGRQTASPPRSTPCGAAGSSTTRSCATLGRVGLARATRRLRLGDEQGDGRRSGTCSTRSPAAHGVGRLRAELLRRPRARARARGRTRPDHPAAASRTRSSWRRARRSRPPSAARPTRTTTAGAGCTASRSPTPWAARSRSRPAPASPTSPPTCRASRPTAATTRSTSPPARAARRVARGIQYGGGAVAALHRRGHAARDPGDGGHRRRRERRAGRPDVRQPTRPVAHQRGPPRARDQARRRRDAASTERFVPIR